MRIILSFFMFFIVGCDNYHKISFNQLSEAFNAWYIKSIDSNYYTYFKDLEDNYFPLINNHIIDDFRADLNRFELEISQINSNHLNTSLKNKFNLLNSKIKDLKFKYEILNESNSNPLYYLNRISYQYNYLFHSNTYSLEDKISMLKVLVEDTDLYITQSKSLLKKTYNYDLCRTKIDDIIKDVIIFFNVNKIDGYEDSIILLEKIKYMFSEYLNWIENNTSLIDLRVDDYYYKNFVEFYFINDSELEDVRSVLLNDINQTFKNLFDTSLQLYIIDNDEPVWVDKSDSLNVIKWSIEHSLNEYNEINFSLNYLSLLDSLNIKESYLESINSLRQIDKHGLQKNNNFIQDQFFIAGVLRKYYTFNIANNDRYIYKNEYFSNAFIDLLKINAIDFYSMKKDFNFELLLSLNLYYNLNKIYYQDMYLRGEIELQDLLDQIETIPLLSSLQKEQIFTESLYPYYFLKEYSLYKDLFMMMVKDNSDIKNRKNILDFLNNSINYN